MKLLDENMGKMIFRTILISHVFYESVHHAQNNLCIKTLVLKELRKIYYMAQPRSKMCGAWKQNTLLAPEPSYNVDSKPKAWICDRLQ